MNPILMGYMASGKTLIGKKLATALDRPFIDLDLYISKKEGKTINEIFKTKGELYFRKLENTYLKEILSTNKKYVLALGGGTPCYGNNLELIKKDINSKSFYLQVGIPELSKRLFKEKSQRPLVAHIKTLDGITEFVGKHLFERMAFYNQADFTIETKEETQHIVEAIILKLI